MSVSLVFSSNTNNPQQLIDEFFSMCDYFTTEEKQKINLAWNLLVLKSKEKLRLSGEPYYLHPLRVALILAQNKMDKDTIICAILHTLDELNVTAEQIKEDFGESVYKIISTTNKILNLPINPKNLHQSDAIRKMFFAMSDDVRIILITLADRLDRLRNLRNFDHEYQKIIAEASIEIWAPLADRLGMQKEKNEFEDLSLKYTNPQVFKQIKAIVAQKQDERASYLKNAVDTIQKKAEDSSLKIQIQSRAKHFYSIYQKMRKRNKEIAELFDLFALRILCESQNDCYSLLGIVHSIWKPLDGRFKDYIAMPKANGYQSLHTTVMCQDKPLEIQIRTFSMHENAEHGVASHWIYKKGTNKELVDQSQLEIINKLQQIKQSTLSNENAFKTLKDEFLGDKIYVFTPKGDVIQLPLGATALDFAYSIHSAIGEKVIAAKADGKIIPLSKPLSNTQIIEVITNPQSHPTQQQLKIVKTAKAHQKIHAWLTANDPTFSDSNNVIKTGLSTEQAQENPNATKQRKHHLKANEFTAPVTHVQKKVLVQGEKNVLYNIAQCCKPEYPDLIVGYMTLTKGIKIHRADCLVYHRIVNKNQKTIEVSWDKK